MEIEVEKNGSHCFLTHWLDKDTDRDHERAFHHARHPASHLVSQSASQPASHVGPPVRPLANLGPASRRRIREKSVRGKRALVVRVREWRWRRRASRRSVDRRLLVGVLPHDRLRRHNSPAAEAGRESARRTHSIGAQHCELRAANCELRAASCRLRAAN